jgi:hypothetical protein
MFALERTATGFGWFTGDTLVASATMVDGAWQLSDARNQVVVTLVALAGGEGHALVGPDVSLVGAIRPHGDPDDGPMAASIAADPDGNTILMLRTDGTNAAHVVDRHGDVVALASWENEESTTDLLVTALGAHHSLAMVFGLLLCLELDRQLGRRL